MASDHSSSTYRPFNVAIFYKVPANARDSSNLLFQNLIYLASFNPEVLPLGSEPCGVDPTAPCHIWWGGGGRHKSYSSVILIGNGLSFLFQSLIFLSIGSLADYGNWNPWVVRIFSVITWAFEFGFLGIKTPDKWQAAMALYILSSKCP
jgi:MFS-type transporter involved in bile tolerance (Atg22 family)